ncbi:MAG: hypothetical protein QM755_17290 [Luteolibacter sp.]
MNMMIRLSLAATAVAGGFLLTSCDPYGPPPGYPRSPYDAPRTPRQPTRGDGYGDPYGSNDSGYGDSYGNGSSDSGYGRDGGASRGSDPYGSNDGGNYTENTPPPRTNPPSSGGSGSGSGTGSGSSSTKYPTATKTANPDRVLSPYPPYNVIDVAGIKSGKLAKDPSTGEVFRVP